ncbi:deoxynucleoside kinase-like [Physella acuta]|uniref:deoxynucleoside kinase-like n=1 Tax=Physella acuta TaxID=109671 RepID=UPI0027DCCEC9|nr:deoxynucleoside kinase-like [Physella acuta]
MEDDEIIPSPTPSPPRKDEKKMRSIKSWKTVLVEGNIGCGKSTFLNYFKKYSNVTVLAEPVGKWTDVMGYNALELMYKDAPRWSCAFQFLVTLSMLEHHKLPEKPYSVKMMERSIYSARHCFIENLKQNSIMPDVDHSILTAWHNWVDVNEDVQVDLIVYLRATPEVCANRIKTRNRSEESGVPIEYLKALHVLHDDWLLHNKRGKLPAPVLVINADKGLEDLQQEIEGLSQDILLDLLPYRDNQEEECR